MGDPWSAGGHRNNGSVYKFPAGDGNQSAYSHEIDLFGNEVTTKNGDVAERLLALYVTRLKGLFPFVATPHLVLNTRNTPLYYLIWADPNKLGLKGADYILRQG